MLIYFLSLILISLDSRTGGKADDDTSCCSFAEGFVITLPGTFTEQSFLSAITWCCLSNIVPTNEGSPVSWSLLYGEDIDAATCGTEIAWLTLTTVISMAMTSALHSVTVAATILALIHLLVVSYIVVFTNFLQSFLCENSFLSTSVHYWHNSFHEAAAWAWDDLLSWYGNIDHIQSSKKAIPFFTIQVDVAWKCLIVTLVGVMKANVLGAVSKRDDSHFFSFCQFHIVVGSFHHWNVSAKSAPDAGGEGDESLAASKFHTSSKRSIMLYTDPQVASQSRHCNE